LCFLLLVQSRTHIHTYNPYQLEQQLALLLPFLFPLFVSSLVSRCSTRRVLGNSREV